MPLLTYRLAYVRMNGMFSVALDLVVESSADAITPTW